MKYLIVLFILTFVQVTHAETLSQAQEANKKASCEMLKRSYATACARSSSSQYCSAVPPGCQQGNSNNSPR